jgi:hypothetical protein
MAFFSLGMVVVSTLTFILSTMEDQGRILQSSVSTGNLLETLLHSDFL